MLARAASCDVTPRDRPVRLAGYALRRVPTSSILDPIEISVVLLECAAQRCLIFSLDLMIVGSELQTAILAGLQPLYVARQLFDIRHGSSAGKAAALMKPVVANLSEDDIIAISSYLGSLPPP